LIPAHNEEDGIEECLNSLMEMCIPDEINEVEFVVIDDRSEDRTKEIAESTGAKVISKNYRGDYVSAISETVAFGVENTEGCYILKCDADVQNIPKNALKKLHIHLSDDIRRVSSEVITKTRQNNPLLDLIFFLRYLNFKVSLKREPRGAFTLFERRTVHEVGGFDKTKPTWDTAFDQRIKSKGWRVELVGEVVVTEKRNFSLKQLVNHQMRSGRSRRKLGVGFYRTLAHSTFRLRLFVVWGYISEVWNERKRVKS